MKATDLMVGDWVYNKHHKKNIQIQPYDFFVHGHGNNGTFAVSSTIVSGRDFVPIPLTEDILVKNGFDKVYNQYFFGQVKIEELDDCWFVTIIKEDADIDINIHYVHQLQHLLRLCGIEKEIELVPPRKEE